MTKKYGIATERTEVEDIEIDNKDAFNNFNNKDIFNSCAASVLATLQSDVSASEILQSIERNYKNAIFRDLGLKLISKINTLPVPFTVHKHSLNSLCLAFRENSRSLAHYSDNLNAIGDYMLSKIRISFFELYKMTIQKLSTSKDENELIFLLNFLRWKISASDHQDLLQSGITKVLSSVSNDILKLKGDIGLANDSPNLSYFFINTIEYIFVSCLSRILTEDEDQKVEVVGSGSAGIKKIQQASSVINTNISEVLMASSFDIAFTQIKRFTKTERQKILDLKFKKQQEIKIAEEKLKQEKSKKFEEQKSQLDILAIPDKDYSGSSLFSNKDTQNIGKGLFGSSSGGIFSQKAFDYTDGNNQDLFADNSDLSQYLDDSLYANIDYDFSNSINQTSFVQISDSSKISEKKNAAMKQNSSENGHNLFTQKPSLKFDKIDELSCIKLLRLVELMTCAAHEDAKMKKLCLKFIKTAHIDILIQMMEETSPKLQGVILQIITNLVTIGVPNFLIEKAIGGNEEETKEISEEKHVFRSKFLQFLYQKSLNINTSIYDKKIEGDSDDLDVYDVIIRLFCQILGQSSESEWAQEIQTQLFNNLSSSRKQDLEESEFWLNLIQGSRFKGISSGKYLKDTLGNIFLAFGFSEEKLAKSSCALKKLKSKPITKTGKAFNSFSVCMNTDNPVPIKNKLDYISMDKLTLHTADSQPNEDFLLKRENLAIFLKKFNFSKKPEDHSIEELYKQCIIIKVFLYHIQKFGDKFVNLLEPSEQKELIEYLLKTPITTMKVASLESYDQRIFTQKSNACGSQASFFKCPKCSCSIKENNLVLKVFYTEAPEVFTHKIVSQGKTKPDIKEKLEIGSYTIFPANEIGVKPSMNEDSLFKKETTVYLSPDDYSQLVKEMEPFQKLAEKYTRYPQNQQEENSEKKDNQTVSLLKNIDSFKDKPSTSLFSKSNKSSIFGEQNIKGSEDPEPSKAVSIFASKKPGSEIQSNKDIGKSIFLDETQRKDESVTENTKEEEKHELKEVQQDIDIDIEPQAIDLSSIVSKFLDSRNSTSQLKNSSQSKIFGIKKEIQAEADTESSKFEFSPDTEDRKLLSDYISLLNVNVFLLMTESFDEDLQETVVDSEENSEKFCKMLTLLINQLYCFNDQKSREQSELYRSITTLLTSLSSGLKIKILLEKFVLNVVVNGTLSYLTKLHQDSKSSIARLATNNKDENLRVNINLLPELVEMLMHLCPEVCHTTEIYTQLVEILFLVICSYSKNNDLCRNTSMCLYKLVFEYLYKKDQDKTIIHKLLNLEVVNEILAKGFEVKLFDHYSSLNPLTNSLSNEKKIMIEILMLFYELKTKNQDISSLYDSCNFLEDLLQSSQILAEGKKFELATYLNHFKKDKGKETERKKLVYATACPRYRHSFRAKIDVRNCSPASLTINPKSKLTYGPLMISKDIEGQEVIQKADISNLGSLKPIPVKEGSLYLHYPYYPNKIWACGNNFELDEQGKLELNSNECITLTSEIKQFKEGLILTAKGELYCSSKTGEIRDCIKLEKFSKELPQEPIRSIFSTSRSYGLITETGGIYIHELE